MLHRNASAAARYSPTRCHGVAAGVGMVMTMPRTVDEILQHADQLTARSDDYEPDPADELDPGAVALLRVGDRIDVLATDPESGEATVLLDGSPVLALPDTAGTTWVTMTPLV